MARYIKHIQLTLTRSMSNCLSKRNNPVCVKIRAYYGGSLTGLRLSSTQALNVCNDFDKTTYIQQRHMAGHSKWQNIKHTKAAKDAQKQAIANQVVNRIRVAIREGGSNNPESNFKLAQVLRYGMSHNVAKNTMEKAMRDYAKSENMGSPLLIECMGPANCLLIVDGLTDKQKWARQQVTHILKQYGGTIGAKGFAAHSFEFKGILNVALKDEKIDLDKATEEAIEVGAEDVLQTTDENDTKVLQFICDSKDLHTVKKNLEEAGREVSEARLAYTPKIFASLTLEQLELLDEVIDKLESLDFVMRVYDNAELAGSS